MKKYIILAITIVCFLGCDNFGDTQHVTYIKNGEIRINTWKTIYTEIGLEKDIANKIELNDENAYKIVVPISMHSKTNRFDFQTSVVDLCKNGIITDVKKISNVQKKDIFISEKLKNTPNNALFIITPTELRNMGFIDNNLANEEICIYPLININYKTMKNSDIVKITIDELNQAITEYERVNFIKQEKNL